jgi:tryptophan-rich sensory protein
MLPISASSVAWVAASAFGGMLGAPFVIQSTKTWYNNIPLPLFTPPKSVFAPVWTVLYTLMGIASWRICNILQCASAAGGTTSSTSSMIGTAAAAAATTTTIMSNTLPTGALHLFSFPFPAAVATIQHNIMLLSLIHYIMNISWAPIFFGLKRL